MVNSIKIVAAIGILLLLTTCKKKTSVTVKVFNPGLNEYVAGAVVSLMEIKDGSLITNGECIEIATATTDANGIATFDNEKLRTKSKYHYKLGIKESWGIAHQNPCGGQTQDYLDVGKSQEIILMDYADAIVKYQFNNVFYPGASGDSINCSIEQSYYCDRVYNHCQGGGGVGGLIVDYDNFYPISNPLISQSIKIFSNRLIVKIRKRKMGIISTSIDTVRAYPNQTNLIQINW